ncbi:MAG: Fis family transcriptional regulator [Chthoniobacteraceae bacterium]|nr:Fis family transcriptional regulator [Chthoniobacteraceae bacterium]MDB6175780.1 Fis family transcriptional regulator [Chthoniobacteraceae bacterium]
MGDKPGHHLVVIDDERPILMTLEFLLKRHGYEPHLAPTASAGIALVRKFSPALVLLDIGLPDANGLDVLRDLKREFPNLPVVMLTANDSLNNAIESIKEGAFHFISKPYAAEELMCLMARAIEQRELVKETESLRAEKQQLSKRLERAERQLAPVNKSRSMRGVHELLERVAPTDANILLTGESGVGKEVLANQIHRMSKRASGPLVKLNCAAFPANMIEAELFGYVKGSFTGALTDFPGMIRESSGGTLFLDEVAEMPPELQTRFLRVLQEREFRALGSTKTIAANFRLVAATNRNLGEALRDGSFRQDLYYRLNTFQIEIPALRDRREDIPALISTFLEHFSSTLGKPAPSFTSEALQFLLDYSWPGNVRELQNTIEYSVILAENGIIGGKQLPKEIQLPPELQIHPLKSESEALNLETREKQTILQALAQSHNNKKKAAAILGIHRPTLYGKMKRLGITL